MPRPYGMIGAAGSYSGVGTLNPSDYGVDDPTAPYFSWNDLMNRAQILGGADSSNTIGAWVQKNSMYLILGGIAGLILFKRN